MPVSSLTPFTLLDYPDKVACILWFSGCNLRCPYCHNPELVNGQTPALEPERIIAFLDSRRGLLDGVVLSGGECTLAPELIPLIREIKGRGFQVKIDSNGCNPAVLEELLREQLIDFVALDYKAPPDKFATVTGKDLWTKYSRSLDLLIASGLPCEIRTTAHSAQLTPEDLNHILDDLEQRGFAGSYHLQDFIHADAKRRTLGKLPTHTPLALSEVQAQRPFPVSFRNYK